MKKNSCSRLVNVFYRTLSFSVPYPFRSNHQFNSRSLNGNKVDSRNGTTCIGMHGLLWLRMLNLPNAPSWAEEWGRAFALGMGTIAWAVFWFGISELFNIYVFHLLLIPGCLILVCLYKRLPIEKLSGIDAKTKIVLICLFVSLFFDALEAFAPPADADTLAYHFAIPKMFLSSGGIEFIPVAVDGAIPLLTHMTYVIALGLGGELSLTLWTFFTQIALMITFFGIAKRWLPT